ncbi:hypothetical protein MBLNU457_6732t1 [Dothideomycetes sp. NU457]
MASTEGGAEHLVVLIHGLWGNPSHLQYLATSLRKAYSEDEIHILVAKSNATNLTYDGIETGGERTTHEIENQIEELEKTGRKITKLSIIGYSLGGLVARYVIGVLYSSGIFDKIQPVNFTTFATPHLGVRTPMLGPHSYLWNTLGSRTLSTSGTQLFLTDNFRTTGRPLLSVMADPNSIFIHGLSLFKNRSLYANIINDKSVVYYSAAISRNDPFVDLSAVNLHSIPNTSNVILDPTSPVTPRNRPVPTLMQRINTTATSTLKSLPFVFFLTVLLPIGSVVFLANSGIQSIRSAQRVRLHESGKAGIGIEKYRAKPPLLSEARSAVDRTFRALSPGREAEEFLPRDSDPEALANGSSTNRTLDSKSQAQASAQEHGREVKGSGQFRDTSTFPTLALTKEQFEMIDHLDDLGITKYCVHISKVRHTHAAIIVRSDRWGFDQGKIVVSHWIENFEV